MKSVHLLLSAMLLSAAAPFIEDQQFSEFHEQQLSSLSRNNSQSNSGGSNIHSSGNRSANSGMSSSG